MKISEELIGKSALRTCKGMGLAHIKKNAERRKTAARTAAASTGQFQENAGGPRGGRGEPVSHAMWADGIGRKAWAKSLATSKLSATGVPGAVIWAHKGHSMPPETVGVSPASSTTIFMPPMAEHTICDDWGLTKGEATATPMNNANHTSTKRVIRCALRKVCRLDMAEIIPWPYPRHLGDPH